AARAGGAGDAGSCSPPPPPPLDAWAQADLPFAAFLSWIATPSRQAACPRAMGWPAAPAWLLLCALVLPLPLPARTEPRQVFQVLEEQPAGAWVGTVVTRPGFTYRLSEHHALFSINATSGALHTRATIDRESLASDVMDLVVLSSQPTYPSEVRVLVLDLNDNAPVFPDPSIVVTFKEDTGSGRQLILDTATDADSGTNGVDHSSYRIVGGNEEGRFRLNITLNPSGEGAFLHLVSRGGLDREATATYQLLVQVEDKGEPRRRGYLQVNVTVQDINDNPPVFSQALYQARVPEDAPVGASVLQVAAADADEGTNADIRYYLEGAEGGGGEGAGNIPFEVDPESGVIRIREPLDYEIRRQYSLTVQATDRGVPALSGRAEALIRLIDVNDNEPRVKFRYFPATSRFASVDENAAPGTVVALLTVSDADSPAANGNISVSILAGNEQRHFEVQSSKVPNLSLIKVAAALDRERIPAYNLTVAVADNFGAPPPSPGSPSPSLSPDGAVPAAVSRSSVASLVIFVNDINDHPPVFGQSVYQVNISEEVPLGSYVRGLSATDRDSGLNANLKYSIVSGNELGWFRISEHSGLVTTAGTDIGITGPGNGILASGGLDRERASEVVLNISARDQGVQPKFSYAQLMVTILDVNDNRPCFSQPEGYQVSLAENSPSGTELLVLSATDGDLGDNGTVRFSLQEAEPTVAAVGPLIAPRRVFRLDPVSGKLSTITQLDREEQSYYSLQVLATDLGSPPLSSVARVNVSVLDVNDNSPVFYPVQYFAHIQENEPAGSYLTTVSATDPDMGLNGTVKYSISAGDTSRFQIHSQTGVITTKIALDREEKTAYQLQIMATDGGHLHSQNQAIVTITVLDTQDNPPVFSQDVYSFVVFENVALGYHVGTVYASTMDLNTNITYLITTGDQRGMFAINKVTGQITTASIIDREEQAFYQLKVVASGGAITGDTMVNITVKDLNDNSPHFIHAVESVNVVENWKAGHTIFQAKAVDPDEGVNGMVLYSLKQNPKGLFSINEQNGNISLEGPLDITAGSYQVEILALDMGVPQLSSSFILAVSVHDVNDNSPVFDQLSYEVTILESEPVNSRFFKVQASDKDSGANGEIAYTITEGNTGDAFGIFPDGQLYIKSELDRELQERYILLVVASDRAVEPLSATVNVTIILEDVNDNRPLFNSTNYVFYFEEEQSGGSFVGKINAVDKDFGPNGEVRYSFENMQPDFELNTVTGEITSTHQFDRESLMRQRGAAVFSLTVIATDQGLPKPLKDQATVQIYMKDINDNAPKFLKDLYQATISELAANLTQVLRVSASDVDEGNNGLIHYSVIKGSEENQFAIDSVTGQVTLVGKLDHEATASYSLIIQAVDSGTVSLSSTCTLSIDVLDENDNSPSFPKSTLFVDVLENMRIGELVSSVTATDSDSGDNADLHYSITGTNNHGTFSISPNTGSIFLAKKLDFETQSLFKLNITAKDQGRPPRSSTMSVVIHVRDFNDNPPNFPPGDIFKSIVENIPVGSSVISVTARDPDADINGQLMYAIIQQMPRGNHFRIDEIRGTIFTNAEIDREFANLFELTVKATDQAVPVESRRFALKNVTILVTDQNDNVPVFISQNALAADPSVVIGSVLTTIIAADPDEGANGEVEYEIINGDTETFIVDRYSGDLRVASALVPSQLIYNLIVAATDLGPERRKSTTEMTVILQGVDGPVFTQPKYITILKEGEPIGTNVIAIEAASPRGSEAQVEYYIVSVRCEDKSLGRLFTIGRHTGVIQTAAILDREQGARLYLVDVYAIEKSAVLPRTQRAEVEITLQDINDNPPVFPTDMLDLTVEENIGDGSKIMQLTAMDADEGANALVTYTIISGADDSFHIDPESGDLIATKRLDRERRSKYSLLVRADDGLQSSDMRINITVSDVNDHTPKFSKPVYSFDIPEDTTPGSLVAAILATDDDSGVNGEITYTVSEDDEDSIFFLNPVTGVFNLTRILDYEMQQYYILTVRAEDGGGQYTAIRVYFNILDVNDNPPLFSLASYSTSLMEDLPPGSTILNFNVTDADDGPNSQLSYSIASGDSLGQFNIDKDGVLSIKKILDRESQSFYSLIVQVHDMASLPASRFTSTAQVSIILLDVNDNPPNFISPKLTYIPENTPIDTIVFKAQATDPDSGPNSYIEYTLQRPLGNKFSIGTIDGEVRLTGELDREAVSNYTLTVVATDKGQPSLSSSTDVVVIVLDINDNNPLFAQKQYKVEVDENTLTGTDLIQVFATDGDEETNGQVRYTIISGNTNNEFRIDSVTGVITVAKPLDREKEPAYTLTVQSSDRGSSPRTDTTTVNIVLMDINDFIPTFELSPYSVNVPENLETLPKVILQVVARDDDQGLNSKLTYILISGNEDGAFTLSSTGELRLIKSLDRETKEKYVLLITAADSGSPALTGTGTIAVTVDDVNDNVPTFAFNMYSTTIPEDAPTGTDILLVNSSDADASVNAVISYKLIGGNSQFTINPSTGQIITSALLDRETKENYTLVVVASDGGFPRALSSSTSVLVSVADVNDNPPKFQHHPYVTHIPSPTTSGSFVFAVTVTDADSGPNAELHYSLRGRNSEKFHIDPTRGAIMAADSLTGDSEVTFSVHVKDGGLYPKTDSTTVTVRFMNKAQFPQVQAEQHTFMFPENQAIGTLVTTVSGSSSRGGSLSYYIASGNLGNTFQIDQLTGQFSICQSLDFEAIQKYVVWIEARDMGFPPFSSYEKLEITVVDVNDNAPEFEQDPFIAEIIENLSPRKILTVTAVDKDSGPNGQLNYEIIDGNKENSFTINRATGEIKSIRPLDREKLAQYVLTVKAFDKGTPLQSTTVKVIVNILDENDNAPRFSQIFSASVPENAPLGYTVTRVTTSDEDIGVNAISRYSIRDPSLPFVINPSTGDITVSRPLNREDTDRYRMRVSAHDSGWTVSTDVTIFVTDINDNAPRFTKPSYYLECPELTEVGLKVTQVSATDPDEGFNGQIFYFIKSQSEFFRINATSGEIFNKQYLKYQNSSGSSNFNINRHSFIVTSSDRGSPPLLSETTVTINIVDSNDNAPRFLASKYFTPVTKNVGIGTNLIKVTAVDDKDFGLNSEVGYFISNENNTNKFKLDSRTGWISVASSLMADLNQDFLIKVKAKDKGNPPLSAEVTVEIVITEENYHTPVFSQSHMSITIPESHAVGAIVRTVSARDRDAAMNGLIKYNISSGNEAGIFSINTSTGALTLAKSLDYELYQKHEIIVSATDGGWVARTGYCTVTVNVIDVNDNSPAFSPEDYFPNVLENAPSGTTVIRLNATDADSGPNAVIAYAIQSSDSDLFVIDPNTGIITTQGFLDYETKQSYHLTVKAFNVPDEERCSFASVNIQLEGTNEYVPRFVSKLYYFEVSEAASRGTVVGEVFASDRDLGTDGEVHYLIFGNSRKKGFQIDGRSGQIYVSGPLDREKEERISLKVLAKNFGSIRGADIDEVIVNITILDANDPPVFSLEVYNIQISEGVPPGTHVTFVSAFDSDSVPSWSRFSYFIGSGNDNGAFSINPQTGQVTVTAELDRETLPVYNLTVLAIDSGSPSATGSASLLVTLEDINDNGPTLSTSQGEVMENNRAGTLVMTLQSSDPDLPPNQGPFSYYLLSTGPATSYFSLSTAGVLTTTREIDREQISDFFLSVITRDSGIPQMSSTGTVQIKVVDQNDNPSQPRTVEIFVHYYGNLFPGGILGNVKPQDPDVLDSFHCSLTSGVTSLFNIPGGTCDLNSQARSTDGTFDLTVLSNDGLHSAVTSSVRVFFAGFNNGTIDNSILLRLSVHTVKDFLTNHYLHFLRIANSQLTGLGTAVQLYGVYEDSNRTFLMAAVKRNNNLYVNPSGVATFFESIKEILFQQSGVRIESVDHDSCIQNPCQNGGSCLRRLAVSPALKSHESIPVIIMANEPLQPFVCRCLPGYDGNLCETDIDECLPSPCHNNGTCHNLVGGFSCSCPDGFTGMACERDINECLSSPCKNGAICQNFPGSFNCVCKTGYTGKTCDSAVNYCECNPCFNGGSCQSGVEGYYCHCPFGVFGNHCELNSYGFEELSYMEFPSMDPNNNYIYIKFATIKSNALMLYNYDNQTGEQAEFLALEITEERLRFSYNLGSGTYKLTTMKKVSDGQFHTVIARRAGMAASLTVDSCSEDQEPGYCTVSNVAVATDWTLDVQPNRVTVGGIRSLEPILQRRGQVESHDFVGCIMEFAVNGRPLEPSQALAAHGILDQCPRLEGACSISPCQHGGTCVDHWSWQQCHCKEGLTGKHCEKYMTADTALSLEGKGRLDYHMSQNKKREYLMRHGTRDNILEPPNVNRLEVKFRTRSENGILIHVQESSNYTTVKIKSGKVHYTSDAGIAGKVERNIQEVYTADGQWHSLLIEKNGSATILSVDKAYSREILHVTQDFGGLNVLTVSLGGIPPNHAPRSTSAGFDGCIEYVKYGGENLPFTGKHSLATISKTDPSVKTGCRGPNVCASNPCWGELMCINQWYAYKCVPPGACASNPCQNGGSCEPGTHSGFTCSCPESYAGRTCEKVVACLGILCAPGHVCKGAVNGGHMCVPNPHPAELSLPLWAVPAIVGSCATVLALLVLSLILCNQCRGKKSKAQKEEKKKEKKKKGSENVAFDDPDNIPPYGDDMTVRKQPEGNPKPDIIERENPYLIYDETDIPHNTETIPSAPLASPEPEIEHYDIENASSIAPSDADIIQHYKQFRSHTPKFSIQRHSPLGFARQSPMPLGASSLTYQPSYSQGLRTTSLSHSACPTPNPLSRHSPAPFSKSSTFYRNSPARELHLSIREGSPLEMHNDVCQPGIFNYATRLGRRSKSPQTMATHGSSRPGSRLKQPIGQIPLETAPPVGLSIEEVERLNTPRPRNPSICSADHGRSSSEEDCRRPLSRTRNPADGIPAPESSSDSDSHESFTCSEMEYDRDKPMAYTSRMPKLSQVNESDADDEDNYGARLKPRRYPGRRGEGGPVGTQATISNVAENTLPMKLGQQAGNFNWDNLLNWGPGFGHYVDVFKDLASLPEKAAATAANEESKGGTIKPVSKDGEAEQYV
ncbi:PREDICTED: protocadherin Fat 4, partial [Gavialis gangeticus]|uniref:protocadherin Fat 4 n=1 Tax=Gavialis gangeticus TaxID=94835 RepID=UPI00092F0A45